MLAAISVIRLCSQARDYLAHSCCIDKSRQAVQSCLLAINANLDCGMLQAAQLNVSAVETTGVKASPQRSRSSTAHVCLGCIKSCHQQALYVRADPKPLETL